jgi:hypothetical protein
MKKSLVFVLAALLVVAFALPASALENQFGGYWRTRYWVQDNFSGDENADGADYSLVDTRTRLYYTAMFSDNFKFVNKFEFDATWGDNNWGDIGADGVRIEIKNSYVDFNTGPMNWKVGVQGTTVARGFIFSDDHAGVVATFNADTFSLPFVWIAVSESCAGGACGGWTQGGAPKTYGGGWDTVGIYDGSAVSPSGTNIYAAGDADVNVIGAIPTFKAGAMSFDIPIMYVNTAGGSQNDSDWYYVGVDFDMKMDALSLWATGIYNGGTIDANAVGEAQDIDVKGYLLALGVNGSAGDLGWHAQGWYATGHDPNSTSFDTDAFVPIGLPGGSGSSYYWSELMGLGMFDNQPTAGSPGDHITNMMAVGGGVTLPLGDKLKLAADLWWASLAEDNFNGDTDLGIEVDVVLTYNVVENLNLDLVGAYQAAGDAVTVTPGVKNQDDPLLIGTRLSFSF